MTGSMLFFFTDMFLGTQIVCSIESWRQLVNNTFGIRINEMKWLLLNSTIYHRMVWISVIFLWWFYVFLFFSVKTFRDDLWVFFSNEKHWKEAGIDNENIKGRTKFRKSFHLCSWFAVHLLLLLLLLHSGHFIQALMRHASDNPITYTSLLSVLTWFNWD